MVDTVVLNYNRSKFWVSKHDCLDKIADGADEQQCCTTKRPVQHLWGWMDHVT